MGAIKLRVLTYTTPRISPRITKGMRRCKLKCAIAKTADVNNKAAAIGMYFVNDGRKNPLNMACSMSIVSRKFRLGHDKSITLVTCTQDQADNQSELQATLHRCDFLDLFGVLNCTNNSHSRLEAYLFPDWCTESDHSKVQHVRHRIAVEY